MKLFPPDGQTCTRDESHAELERVLAEGRFPFAECRELALEDGSGVVVYEVHDPGGAREAVPPTPEQIVEKEAREASAEEWALLEEEGRLLRVEHALLAKKASNAELRAKIAALKGGS